MGSICRVNILICQNIKVEVSFYIHPKINGQPIILFTSLYLYSNINNNIIRKFKPIKKIKIVYYSVMNSLMGKKILSSKYRWLKIKGNKQNIRWPKISNKIHLADSNINQWRWNSNTQLSIHYLNRTWILIKKTHSLFCSSIYYTERKKERKKNSDWKVLFVFEWEEFYLV